MSLQVNGNNTKSVISDEQLIDLATKARELAHAPYSKFSVGAALIASDGRIFTGCNVENSTYSLSVCAERVAALKAVSEGALQISRIAVVADTDNPTPPCGSCRQMMWEFGTPETEVLLANLKGNIQKSTLAELYPLSFDSSFLSLL
jgi:cytidine deaminase